MSDTREKRLKSNLQYVSFDVFGTLIDKVMDDVQLYDLIGQTLNNEYDIKIDDFTKQRISAEKLARKKYGNTYNLQEIYDEFSPAIKADTKEKIIDLEKKYWIDNAILNFTGHKLYSKYSQNYKIIAISDMFLDAKTIYQILQKNRYKIDKIYSSSDIRKSKYERSLYREVLKDLGISKNQIIHIGDAKRSDWLNAKLEGIKSILINNNADEDKYYYDWGFRIFGPVMYGFCQWINKNHQKDEKLLFVSREGEVLQEFYDILYPNTKSKVIYLSRNAVLSGVAKSLFEKYSINQIIKMISIQRTENVRQFLTRFGMDANQYKSELAYEGINIDNTLLNVNLQQFFSRNKKMINEDLQNTSQKFKKYLKQELTHNNVLVDIGWKGSMQDLLTKYLDLTIPDKTIRGLYLGSLGGKNKSGYLFNGHNGTWQDTLNYSGLLEVILMPDHGSVLGYKEIKNHVEPIFDKSEFDEQSRTIILQIQNGVKDFLRCMKKFSNDFQIAEEKNIQRLNLFGNRPSIKDIRKMGKLNFYENGEVCYLVNVEMKNLKRSFMDSKWKTAYLKSLLKIDLPYGKMVSALRRKVDRDA